MSSTKPPVLTNEMKHTLAGLSDAQLGSIGLMRMGDTDYPPQHNVYPEVSCAATWWSNQLRGVPLQDNGDPLQTILATVVSADESPLTEKDINRFEQWLTYSIMHRIANKQWPGYSDGPSWRYDNPSLGSATRTIYNDYGPDAILVFAAKRAGIPGSLGNRFPIKTCMWINPGEVKVRCGYAAPEVTLFPAK